MTSVTLPSDLQAWAQREVDAGYAPDVATVIVDALQALRQAREQALLAAFRATLDEASLEIAAGHLYTTEEVFGPIRARLGAKMRDVA